MQPAISVIMATYNEPLDYLKQSIESILNQTFKDFEFIIILDNPENKEIEKFIKKYQKNDKRIIFLKNEKNLGKGITRNRGIDIAKGKYIAIIDADDIAFPKRLEKQLKYIQENKKDIIFSYAVLIDEEGNKVGKFNPDVNLVENFEKNIFTHSIFLHPSMFIKTEILKKLKYDIKFFYAQDFELMLRLIQKGYKFSIIPEFLMYYRTPQGLSFNKRLKKLKGYSKYTFMALYKNKNYFWKRIDFWKKFFYSLFAWLSIIILPKKFNIILLRYLDKKRKRLITK